MKELSNA